MCNNASNNNTMIDELAELLEKFPGSSNCTRCFLHPKTLLKQIDLPKKAAKDALDNAEKKLLDLADGLDSEALTSEMIASEFGNDKEEPQNDNMDGWVDKMEKLSEDERVKLMDDI